jgi:hypothetical protein
MNKVTCNLELNSKVCRDGRQLIFVRISLHRKMRRISSGIYVFAKDFYKNAKYGKWIRRSDPQDIGKNNILTELLYKAETATAYLKERNIEPSLDNVRDYLSGSEMKKETSFFAFSNVVLYGFTNAWQYKIVAHFEAQTYQTAKPLINCYIVQI